ncbi:hypothetical protein AVEN_205272-1 [Araneus ventricosus]|uniref:Uncharacterized protein n=1 Tax=Araneus ventricosus TaxID=182803 RepID=A0A4Y2EGU4_ARAVE|nr:hypothetical protein AVEN_205272-1 [Araneus ventricosus]
MRMADYAWKNVTETKIKNHFLKAEFPENKTSRETEEVDSIKHSIGAGEINPEQWALIQNDFNTNISFEDFLDADNELQKCDTITDESFGDIATLKKNAQSQKDSVRRQTSIKDFFIRNY